MPIRRQKRPSPVTYFVVDCEESTHAPVYSRDFLTLKDAELFKMVYAERPDVLTGTMPEQFNEKR
jgi:hypothetical protein